MKKPAIILDFGAVVLNIDFQKTIDAFKQLGIENFKEIFSKHKQSSLMQEFECGKTSCDEFRMFIKSQTKNSLSNQEIDLAWNALLLDYPIQRIEFLQRISQHYPLYLLSNTNKIHHEQFQLDFYKQFGFELNSLFIKAYYSHLMGDRKPNLSCFEAVLKEQDLTPNNTIFIDDTLINVDAAKKLDMIGIHLTDEDELTELLPRVLAQFNQ